MKCTQLLKLWSISALAILYVMNRSEVQISQSDRSIQVQWVELDVYQLNLIPKIINTTYGQTLQHLQVQI